MTSRFETSSVSSNTVTHELDCLIICDVITIIGSLLNLLPSHPPPRPPSPHVWPPSASLLFSGCHILFFVSIYNSLFITKCYIFIYPSALHVAAATVSYKIKIVVKLYAVRCFSRLQIAYRSHLFQEILERASRSALTKYTIKSPVYVSTTNIYLEYIGLYRGLYRGGRGVWNFDLGIFGNKTLFQA